MPNWSALGEQLIPKTKPELVAKCMLISMNLFAHEPSDKLQRSLAAGATGEPNMDQWALYD